jgi:hypothetical protein
VLPVDDAFQVDVGPSPGVRSFLFVLGTKEYAAGRSNGIPLAYALEQNFPNPFNPATTIRYQLPRRAAVILEVYDLLGRKVRTLLNDLQSPGVHTVTWAGTDDAGVQVSSGVYFYRLRSEDFTAVRKLLFIR